MSHASFSVIASKSKPDIKILTLGFQNLKDFDEVDFEDDEDDYDEDYYDEDNYDEDDGYDNLRN